MNKFNLTFSGEILAGYDPAEVKLRFGELLAIDDPARLDHCFSGQTVVLRRNLKRKDAAQCYHELHLLGAVSALVKVTTSEAADTAADTTPGPRNATAVPEKSNNGSKFQSKNSHSRGQTWAVSSATTTRGAKGKKRKKASAVSSPQAPAKGQHDVVDVTARVKTNEQAVKPVAAERTAAADTPKAEPQRNTGDQSARETQQQARSAEEAATRQRENDEAERVKAAKAAARRKAAEAEAQRKAQRKQKKAERTRKKAEAAARRKAEQEAQKRRQEEQEQQRQAELEARQRQVEEEARRKAEQAEQARREAEEDARLQAELAAIKRREEQEAARLQAELEAKTREAAARAEQIKAVAQHLQLEAQRKSAERRQATTDALAAQQPTPGAAERADTGNIPVSPGLPRQTKARVKTALELPLRSRQQSSEPAAPTARKRQPGEPNLYRLRPFRANEEIRTRAERARQHARSSYTVGMIALAVLLLATGSFLQRPVETLIQGARALALAPHSGPLLLAGDSLLEHDRAGNSTTTVTLDQLQLNALAPPMAFDSEGVLFARGSLASDTAESALHMLRCELPSSKCAEFSPELREYDIDAFVLNPIDHSILLADSQAGLLFKADHQGKILARADVTLPERVVLRLHAGLLVINSADAPALSVLRYEDNAFGKQLDEILLLPPEITEAEQQRVDNFLWSGDAWWVSLKNRQSGAVALYRFDEEWNFLGKVALPFHTGSLQLTGWRDKTLVSEAQHLAIERFNAQGAAEAQFVSSGLEALVAAQQRRMGLSNTAWRGGLLVCAIIAAYGLGLGYLQSLRRLVYHTRRESGAEPVDDYVDGLRWIDPVDNRSTLLRRRALGYGLMALGILLVAAALSVSVWQLTALLLALAGPLAALLLLNRKPIGHIGVLDERLLLVDHSGMYHFAGGSRIQHRGPFLSIDDVVVFTGTRWLPAFSIAQLHQQVSPLALGGVKVDRNTMLVKLLQSRHPLAVGALATLGAAVAAMLLLSLQVVY